MTTLNDQLSALVVDSDQDRRIRLRSAAAGVHVFGDVKQSKDPKAALRALSVRSSCDVVFISDIFPPEVVSEFVREAKATRQGVSAAYIIVLRPRSQNTATISQNLAQGTDGFLCDPYSADSMLKISEIAHEVRKVRQAERQRAAVSYMLQDASKLIDRVSLKRLHGQPPGRLLQQLREVGKSIAQIPESCWEPYLEALTRIFNDHCSSQKFDEAREKIAASKRLSEMMRKRREQLDKELLKDPPPDYQSFRVIKRR